MMELNTCTEDRIQHVLQRCLCDIGFNTPDKQLWNAGLCMNRWCLEELVMRDSHNFLFLLQTILKKTKEVLLHCRYELLVPLTLLFSSALLKTPYLAPDCDVLQEAYLLFHHFLSWPDPYCTACSQLLETIHNELRAPGITFQRLVKTENGIPGEKRRSQTVTVLLVSPDEDIPPEVQSVSKQLSVSRQSDTDITITLILHSFQASLGAAIDLQRLYHALQAKQPEELEQLLETVTRCMDAAASTEDLSTARQSLLQSMAHLRQELLPTAGDHCLDGGFAETFTLPFPKCHTSYFENDNFDFLRDILTGEYDLDLPGPPPDEDESHVGDEVLDRNKTAHLDFENLRLSPSQALSSDRCHTEDTKEGQACPSKPRKKPKKKSKSLIGIEHFFFFKNPRHVGMQLKQAQTSQNHLLSRKDPLSPQKHLCIRRRPILSSSDTDASQVPTLVRVLVFGRDREAGRLARAYSNLQQKEAKCPTLTRVCKLRFYFIPTKRKFAGKPRGKHASTESGPSSQVGVRDGISQEDSTTDLAQMLGMMDPWYDRSVHSLLSLSSDVLCQPAYKEGSVAESGGKVEHLPLLADLLLYYCRHAEQPVLVQLYRAELTLAGGEKRSQVFIHSLELGHAAATRAVKAMGAAGKRFGIDQEGLAVPLTLRVAYNKVASSGRSKWTQAEMICTSINIHKASGKAEHLGSRGDSFWLSVTEVVKKACPKSKKSSSQDFSITEVKVNRVEVSSGKDWPTFAVCLDQDQRTFLQSVTRPGGDATASTGLGNFINLHVSQITWRRSTARMEVSARLLMHEG
uniref:phosphoinositide 3-kinase regulatory subunit 5-like isoform X2 n=1 Tax=Doryrhamphus excisus TaxID=161450 RepID=UPI0025ADC628|nr:phosphoinositide 3-kinase regulatory subunit 5-like isoform X2 [Doryrhamphus excisus]